MSSVDELKPCPFCGSPAYDFNPDGDMEGYHIGCSGKMALFGADESCCPMHSFSYPKYEDARAAWNHRVASTAAPQPAPMWRDISTAPKDGPILAYNPVQGVYATRYDRGEWPHADWYSDDLGRDASLWYPRPTHWQLLPPPPAQRITGGHEMSFKRYMVAEAILFLFVVLTLPMWFPVWLFFVLKDWYADCRYGWECVERNRIHDEARAAAMTQQVPERAE